MSGLSRSEWPEWAKDPDTVGGSFLAEMVWVRGLCRSGEAKLIRQRAQVSTGEMAEDLGVTTATVSRWENGIRRPTARHAPRYAQLLMALEDEWSVLYLGECAEVVAAL